MTHRSLSRLYHYHTCPFSLQKRTLESSPDLTRRCATPQPHQPDIYDLPKPHTVYLPEHVAILSAASVVPPRVNKKRKVFSGSEDELLRNVVPLRQCSFAKCFEEIALSRPTHSAATWRQRAIRLGLTPATASVSAIIPPPIAKSDMANSGVLPSAVKRKKMSFTEEEDAYLKTEVDKFPGVVLNLAFFRQIELKFPNHTASTWRLHAKNKGFNTIIGAGFWVRSADIESPVILQTSPKSARKKRKGKNDDEADWGLSNQNSFTQIMKEHYAQLESEPLHYFDSYSDIARGFFLHTAYTNNIGYQPPNLASLRTERDIQHMDSIYFHKLRLESPELHVMTVLDALWIASGDEVLARVWLLSRGVDYKGTFNGYDDETLLGSDQESIKEVVERMGEEFCIQRYDFLVESVDIKLSIE